MNKQRSSLRAGIFILISTALILGMIVIIKGGLQAFEPMQTRKARFALSDDLGGLRVGDNLRIGGYTVGEVKDIRLVQSAGDEQPFIVVTFDLPKAYVIRTGVKLSVGGTLTGTSWLNFEDLGNGAVIPRDQVLDGHGNPFNEIMATAGDIVPKVDALISDARDKTLPAADKALQNVQALTANANDIVVKVRQEIDPVVARYNKVTDSADSALNEVGKLANSTRTGTVGNLNDASAMLKQKLPALLDSIQKSVDAAHGDLVAVKPTIENSNDITGRLRGLMATNQARLDQMIHYLAAASDNMNQFTIEIRNSPWRLLYKPTEKEMANVPLYDAVRQFADAAEQLHLASATLRDSSTAGNTVTPQQLKQMVDQLNASFEQFQAVQQKLWAQTK